VEEFGAKSDGVPSGTRVMVLRPLFWRSMAERIQGVERGVLEPYSDGRAYRWAWQVTRGLLALQESDLYFSELTLGHVLLTGPDGDCLLTGFDVIGGEAPDDDEEGAGAWDSRAQARDLGRCLLMILTCRVEHVGIGNGSAGGKGLEQELRRFAPPMRDVVSGLLAGSGPSQAMPLEVAVAGLDELRAVFDGGEGPADAAPVVPGPLLALQQGWWEAVQALGLGEPQAIKGAQAQAEVGEAEAGRLEVAAKAALELGTEWSRQGKPYKAVEMFQDAQRLLERRGGAVDVATVAELRSRRAEALQAAGRHLAAIPVLEGVLRWCKDQVQGDGQDRAVCLANVHLKLAKSRRAVGKPEDALLELQCAMDVVGAEKGAQGQGQQPELRDLRCNVLCAMAAIQGEELGHHVQALELYDQALECLRQTVPKGHPRLSGVLISIAHTYAEKGDMDVALTMLVQAYKRLSEGGSVEEEAACMGVEGCLAAARALESIGKLFVQSGRLADALLCFRAAHERRLTVLPATHPVVAAGLHAIGVIHEKRGDPAAATTPHQEALEIRRSCLPPLHPELASSMLGLGNCRLKMNDASAALEIYQVRSVELLHCRAPLQFLNGGCFPCCRRRS
jgi:tetratricopeptide (TPR) repeat protein